MPASRACSATRARRSELQATPPDSPIERARALVATFITRFTMNSTTADWNEARRSRVSWSGSPAGKRRSSPRARAWRSTAVLKPLNEKSRLPSLLFGGDSGTDRRSEERRVGEEGRSPWAPDSLKKKKKV